MREYDDQPKHEKMSGPRSRVAKISSRRRWQKTLSRCNGKHSYRSPEEAEHIRRIREDNGSAKLFIYKCPHFSDVPVVHWHLTHKPPRR